MKILTFIKQNLPNLILLLNSCIALFFQSYLLTSHLNEPKINAWECSNTSCPMALSIFEIVFFIVNIYAIIIGLYFIAKRPYLSQLLLLLPVTFIFCIFPFIL